MRTKKAVINAICGLIYMLVVTTCGFVSMHVTLRVFGSHYNGLTSSITQFLGLIAFLQAGIAGVAQVAMYKPLAVKNYLAISVVVRTVETYMRKIGIVFIIFLLIIASGYPLVVKLEYDWFFVFSFTLIIGITTFVQYFFGLTYSLLLSADQRQGFSQIILAIIAIVSLISFCLVTNAYENIRFSKLVSGLVGITGTLIIFFYARNFYKIDRKAKIDNSLIKQRWEAMWQNTAYYLTNNTDMVILTLFSVITEVSVYYVYYAIVKGLTQVFSAVTSSVQASFGSMFAKEDNDLTTINFRLFEQVVFILSEFLFGVALVMQLPFVEIYTHNITDVNYIRPGFSIFICLTMFVDCSRMPYYSIFSALGHFRQTRFIAIGDLFINIFLSLTLVSYFGIVGVITGTLIANLFKGVASSLYVYRRTNCGGHYRYLKRLLISIFNFGIIYYISGWIPISTNLDYLKWVEKSIIVSLIALTIVLLSEIIFYKKDLMLILRKLHILSRKGELN